MKTICFLHPRFHSTIIEDILKNVLKTNASNKCTKNKDLCLYLDRNKLNIKCLSVYWLVYVLENTWATFEVQFMKKRSKTDAELKKSVAHKKACFDTFYTVNIFVL